MLARYEADITAVANLLRNIPGLPNMVHIARRLRENIIDRRLNIRTARPLDRRPSIGLSSSFGDALEYQVVDYQLLRRYMEPLRIGPDDVLIDIGCGMGRVLCVFARTRLRKCIGIEISEELASIAKRNARSLHGCRTPIEIRVGDAAEADYSVGTIFWIYNPFGERTMYTVLSGLGESLSVSPRRIQIVYVNPVCEAVFRQFSWLICTGVRNFPFYHSGAEGAKVSYWTNV
jgi:SAM-dependent methyltransferase